MKSLIDPQRVRYWRERRRLTQEVAAGLMGYSASWLQKVEQGVRVVDRLSVLCRIAEALGVNPNELLTDLPPAHADGTAGVRDGGTAADAELLWLGSRA